MAADFSKNDRRLRRMQMQIRILRKKNRRLMRELQHLRNSSRPRWFLSSEKSGRGSVNAQRDPFGLSERVSSAESFRTPYAVGFWLRTFRSSVFYRIWQRLVSYARRYRCTVLVLQIFLFLLALPKNSAIFLLFSALLLPVLSGILLTLTFLSRLLGQRERRKFLRVVSEKHRIFVFFIPKNAEQHGDALFRLFSHIQRTENAMLLILSPYLFSGKGLIKTRRTFFVAARQEAPDIFLLRTHFYYSIRDRLGSDPVCFF